MMALAEFVVGESFSSYDSLDAKIRSYLKAKFSRWAKRDIRILEMPKKRIPKRVEANPCLIYCTIYYACVFGGKKYKMKELGRNAGKDLLCTVNFLMPPVNV